jgi:hypothetical protein
VTSPTRDELYGRPLLSVREAASWAGIPERSFRAALSSELSHLVVHVGHRVYVRTSALLAWAGVPPNGETG